MVNLNNRHRYLVKTEIPATAVVFFSDNVGSEGYYDFIMIFIFFNFFTEDTF